MFRFGALHESVGMRSVCFDTTSVVSFHRVSSSRWTTRLRAAFLPVSIPVPLSRVLLAWLNPDTGLACGGS